MRSRRDVLKFLKHLLGWMAWAGFTVICSQLFTALSLPTRSLRSVFNDFLGLRTWGMFVLPIMVWGGLLMTVLEALGILKRDRLKPGQRLGG